MAWPAYKPEHYCYYRRLAGSSEQVPNGINWVERCRCGNSVQVSLDRGESFEKSKVRMRKTWVSKDGTIERVTGSYDN